MIPEEMLSRIKDFVEDVESACDDMAEDFWRDIDHIGNDGVAYDNNELTKELLNALEHVFTRGPKDDDVDSVERDMDD